MMKLLLLILSTFMFLGCSTIVPVATKYKIDLPIQEMQETKTNSKCASQSIKVLQSFSPTMLMSSDMYYVIDNNKMYSYSESQWAIAPNKILSSQVYQMLRDIKLFRAVQSSKSRTSTSWVLESKLEDFMQYYENENKDSFVKISVDFTLINDLDSSVIASKLFSVKVKAKSANADGGVDALKIALTDILLQTNTWLKQECQ